MTRKVYAILVVTFLALLGLGLHSHQHSKQLCRNNRKSITVRDLRTITEPLSSLETASLCPEVKGSSRATTKEAKTTEVTPAAVDQTVSDATRFEGETRDVRVVVTAAEGVFPAGTEMRVTPASAETTMAAAQKQCDDEQEVVDAVAADITFWFDGREIQPDGNVIVSMYAKRNVEGETHEAVTVRHDGIAEVMGDACGNMGAFTTDHFTVYAIVGKTYGGRNMTKYARQVYNFYLDGTLIQTQIVKNGDALVAPPAPGGYSKKEFIGWFKENTDTEFPFGTVSIPSTQTTNDTFRIDARFKGLYKATFYANLDKSVVFQVKSAEDGQQVSTDDVVMPDSIQTVSVYKIFDGWKGVDGNIAGEDTTIAGTDVEFVPNFVKGNWVFFDSRGGSYVRDTLVKEGGKVTEPEAPTYEGHTFLGWEIYNATDSKYEDFDFENTVITNTTTLFAKWQKNQTRYKIKIWHENADDENYTLVDSMYKDGNVGENIPFDELLQTFTRDKYDGFHLNQTALPTWFNNISNFTKQFNYQAQYSIYGDYDHGWYGEPYYGGDAGYGDWLRDSANTNRYLFSVNANGDTTYFFRWYIDESTWDTVWTNDTIKVFSYYDAGAYIDLGHPFLIFQNGLPSGYAVVDTTMTLVDPAINKWQVTLNGINSTDGDITIHEDGSTVVNIYYSRDTYRFLFRFGRVYCENDSGRVWNENDWSWNWCNDYYSNPNFDWSFDCGNLWYDYYYKNCSRNEDNSGMAVNKLNRSNFQRSLNHFHINPHHNWNSNYMLSTSYYNEAQNKTVYPMYWVVTVSGLPYDRQYRYTDLWNTAMSVKYGENLYRAINNLNSNYRSSSDQPIEIRAKVGYFIDDVDWAWYATWKEDNLGCDFTPYMNQEEINPTKDNQITFDGNFLKNADGTPKYPHGSEVQMVLRRFDKDGFMQYRHPYTYYYEGFPNDVTGVRSNSYYNKSQSDTTGISKTIDGTNHTFVSYDDKIVWGTVYYPENAWLNRPMEGFTTVLVENYKSNSTAIYPETTTSVTGDPQLWKFFSRDDEWQSIPYRLFQYTFVSGTNNKVIQDTTYLNNVTDDQVHPTISFYNIRNQYPVKFMDGETVLVDSSFYYEQYLNLSPELADSLHVIALNRIDDVVLKGNKVTKHENGISYRFEGWYTDPQFEYPASYPTTMPYHELTYHAKWVPDSVAVTFHFENGQSDTTIMVKYDNACALPDAPVWEGHSFIRWEDANDIAFNENGTMLKDTNVYARWSTFFTYAVRYNAGTAGTFSTETDPCTYLEGAYAATLGTAVPNNPADTVFSGWRIGNSDNILTQGLFAINSTNDEADTKDSVITLNAVYTPVPRFVTQITYHANYPTRSAADTTIAQNYIINDDYVINQDTTSLGFRMAGYKFFAWSPEASPNVYNPALDPDRVLYFTGDTIALEAQDNHLYAIWIPMQEYRITKVWDDNGNQDGKRVPVEVKLMANDDSIGVHTFGIEDNPTPWDTLMPVYNESGESIVYTIQELAVPEGYRAHYPDNFSDPTILTVTNTRVPDSMLISVKKLWEDHGNQDGKRPTSVTVTLYANDVAVENGTVTLNAGNNWEHLWGLFPFYKDGNPIDYTVTEESVDGYNLTNIVITTINEGPKVDIDVPDVDVQGPDWHILPPKHFIITNTHTPETMTVTANKIWADHNNVAGKRPAKLVYTLEQDGHAYNDTHDTVTVTNGWSKTWTNLPKYHDGGVPYNYSVSEDQVDNYSSSDPEKIKNDANNTITFNFTNSYTPGKTSITVTKAWNDGDNQDGLRPTNVTVQLQRKPENSTVWTDTLSPVSLSAATNNWNHTFSNLEMYVPGLEGVRYEYRVRELDPSNNKIDNGGQYFVGTNGRFYTVEYLSEGNLIVRNSMTPETTKVVVKKIWNDDNNRDAVRPENVTVQLKADGNDCREPNTLKAANNWTCIYEDLPKYNHSTTPIAYTVTEETVPAGYSVAYGELIHSTEADTLPITNTHELAKVEVTVNKVWDDNNNQDGARPNVSVQLYADGDEVGAPVALTESNLYTHTWSGLDKYQEGQVGQPVLYTLQEVGESNGKIAGTVAGTEYTVTYAPKHVGEVDNLKSVAHNDTMVITNSYTPDSINIAVYKNWDDNNNADNLREPVKVVLYQTTDATLAFNPATENPGWNVASDTLTIPVCTETTNWMECHVSWSVPVYSAGNELRYAVKEVSTIADYVTTYAHGGLLTLENDNSEIITNLHRSSVSVDFDVHKKLRGRVWLETDTFAVALLPTQNSNPMPDGTPVFSGTPYSIMKMFSTQEHVNDSVRRNGFGEITFTMDDLEGKSDSTFVYRIFELTPGASALPEIPGITYDGTLYQAEVTVSVVPGEDSLQASVAYFVLHNDDSKIPAELPLITNIFNESYIIYKINAYKILTSYDAPGLGDNEFSFTLKPVGENAATAPMPAGTNADRILTAHNEGTEVKFHDSDNPNDGLRFDYDELRLSGFTDEQLLDGIHFGYEMSEVIPADAVFNNDGTATYSKNANGITTYYDAVIHHRSLFVKMEEVNDVVVLSVHPDLSVHKDFYLNGNDTVWLAATDPGFDKRHSFGGAPIFVNFRIADTAVAVKKEWVDGGNTGNFRPENLTVTLYANGESTNQTATLNANNLWTCRFEGLPTAILNETLGFDTLRYTVVETPVEHYLTPEYSGNAAIGYTITNTLEEKFVNIPVTKIWDDQSNNDGFRPDSVTFQLTGHTDLTDTVFTMKVGGEGNQWDTVFKNLPKYDGARNEFVYTLSEPNTPNHYEQSVNGYTVTNIHVPETTSITVNKVWDDNNDQDGKRQEVTVTVQLNANGEYYDMQTLDEGNSYKYTFENLPVFANGQRITYTVSEWDMDYYTPYITSNDTGFTITNKHEPEYIEITAKKNWIDQNNHDNLRPSSVNVRLMAYTVDPFTGNFDNGTPIAFNPIYANQNWKISFGTWPKYANGNEILYLIEEDPVDHYTTLQPIGQFISDDKIEFTISNQHIPDSIDLTVCKIWDDNHDVDQLRENVYMLLFRSYNPTATFDPEHLPVNGNSDWAVVGNPFYLDSEIDTVSVTWAHMPKYYQGTEVRYAVKELNCPSNYTASYHFGGELLESNDYVDTITNRHLTAAVTVNIPAVRKKLVGRNWLETDTFYMALIPRRSTQPMPTTVASIDGINYAPLAITANSTFVNDSMREGVFAPITFTMDDMEGETTKTFTYRIREITPAEMGFTRIPGISYGADFYMVDIIVSENNNNELVIDSWHYYRAAMNEEQNELIRLDEVANPVITNRYSDSTTVYHMTADKQLSIVGYADTLRTGDYLFMLKPVGENADRAPMPYYTTGTGVNRSLTVPNEGNVVRFYNDTLPVDGLVFNYDSLIAAGFTAEQLTQGVEFEYEMHEIIPDGATYTNNGFWTKPAVREGQMIDEIYDGLVHYRNLRIKMVEVNNKVILSITSVNDDHMRDYFVDANGDTTFVTHESPMFNQRHGEGGAPIFRNGRIARLSIPVEKSWDDFDNELSTRPAEVTVTLLADGEPTDYTITLNASNEWQAAFENLPASTPTTGLITYTVREDSVPHYEATYRGDMENGFFIINTLTSFGEDDECTIMVGIEQLNACTEAECPSIVTDMDGITYPTVKVDGYCWMAENLRTQTPNAMVYRSALSPDTVANLATYGRLYTWFDAAGGTETPEAVNGYVRGICPNGWHLPTVQEINVLRTHRSDDLYGEASWVTTGLNSTGFNALPAGFYNAAADRFEGLHSVTYLHGATEETAFSVVYYCCRIMEWHYAPGNAYSVRCVKDCE